MSTPASERISARDEILARVRQNPPAAVALPELTRFAPPEGPQLERFAAALARLGGAFESLEGATAGSPTRPEDALEAWLARRFPDAAVVVSATPECRGTRALHAGDDPRTLEDVDVGVVRAAFGVAETGSVFLSEAELQVNALAFLAQHLVVLLDPSALVPGLADAYRDPRFASARYAVLLTGPSATADIEGVLVRGAQGVRSLTVLAVAAPA